MTNTPQKLTPEQAFETTRDKYMGNRDSDWLNIYDTLRSFRMGNMACDDDPSSAYPLVDLMSCDGCDVGDGEEQMVQLADEISIAMLTAASKHTGADELAECLDIVLGEWGNNHAFEDLPSVISARAALQRHRELMGRG